MRFGNVIKSGNLPCYRSDAARIEQIKYLEVLSDHGAVVAFAPYQKGERKRDAIARIMRLISPSPRT